MDKVLRGHKVQDEHLGDFCDGSLFKNHPLFSVEPHALQIMLYFDELEVCNPLGSSAKVHKLGMCVVLFEVGIIYILHACACRCFLLSTRKHISKIQKFA